MVLCLRLRIHIRLGNHFIYLWPFYRLGCYFCFVLFWWCWECLHVSFLTPLSGTTAWPRLLKWCCCDCCRWLWNCWKSGRCFAAVEKACFYMLSIFSLMQHFFTVVSCFCKQREESETGCIFGCCTNNFHVDLSMHTAAAAGAKKNNKWWRRGGRVLRWWRSLGYPTDTTVAAQCFLLQYLYKKKKKNQKPQAGIVLEAARRRFETAVLNGKSSFPSWAHVWKMSFKSSPEKIYKQN